MSWFPRLRILQSTGARFAILNLVLTLVATGAVFAFVYQATDRLVLNDSKLLVDDQAAMLMAEYRAGGVRALAGAVERRTRDASAGEYAYLLVDSAGRPVTGNLAAWPPTVPGAGSWAERLLYRTGASVPERIGLHSARLSGGYRLLVGKVLSERRQLRESLAVALLGGLLLGLPLSFLGSAVLLRFVKTQVRAISQVAARVEQGDFHGRIPVRGVNDPFDELAEALNRMFARLQRLIEELRIVTDSLAHDLRSPLTRMRVAVERASPQSSQSADDALAIVSAEIDRMLRMLATTLEVSRAEAGIGRESFERFDVRELADDLCEMYQPIAEERGVSIGLEDAVSATVLGNRELLAQAIANLIDNALKYAGQGKEIRIHLARRQDRVDLAVADRGPGIDQSERATALMRYRRLDSARTQDGAGLGLALVEAVARLHGGELILEDNQPGLRAVLRLPIAR